MKRTRAERRFSNSKHLARLKLTVKSVHYSGPNIGRWTVEELQKLLDRSVIEHERWRSKCGCERCQLGRTRKQRGLEAPEDLL